MIETDTGLTLLICQAGRRSNWTFQPLPLRPFVSRVLLVTGTPGRQLGSMLGGAFPSVEVEHLLLDESGTAADWTARLHRQLGDGDHWLLLLNAGCNADIAPNFNFYRSPAAHNVLYRSRDGRQARWTTALVPDHPAYLSVDPSGRVAIDTAFSEAQFSDEVIIDAPEVFEPARKSRILDLEQALAGYRRDEDPERALEIAACHLALSRYLEAGFWYQRCLAGGGGAEGPWLPRYQLARCLQHQGRPWREIEAALAEAFEIDPNRAEPVYYTARHYFEAGDFTKSYQLADIGMQIDKPRTRYPFELAVYNHELPLTYMACAARLRKDRECVQAANDTLRRPGVPETARVEAAGHRSQCLARLQPPPPCGSRHRNRIVVICPFRNAGEFLAQCVASLAEQDYQHSRFILVDDASTDGALDALEIDDPRFTIIRNETQQEALQNQVDALNGFCEPEDIAVYLDGDDRLLGKDALAHINDFFNATGCWLIYGQYRTSDNCYGTCQPIVAQETTVLEAMAEMHFPMHIRAHRAGLFHRLQEIDPGLQRLRDDDGNFLNSAVDLVMMRMLMQLAGFEHIRYNDRIIYEYNTRNPSSHFRERKALQDHQCRILGTRPPLQPIATYLPTREALDPRRAQTSHQGGRDR